MVIDADDFVGNFNSSASSYRFMRNTIAHEHGHGTGYIHTVPCNNTKLMEPSLSTSFDMLEIDDIRGAQRNYGDRFAGNNLASNAKDFGDLTSPAVHSVIEKSLSTNGSAGFNNSDEDWFRFTIDSAQNVVISVDPTGGSYVNGQQDSGCSGDTSTIVADQAGNLAVELRNAAGTTVLMSSNAGAAGVTETINAAGLAAGEYTVRVNDAGPNNNQTVQLYDLTIRVGTSKAPPQAVAGVNKRIQAGQTCWFMGNANSFANESGASITSYAWDLDGDGTFEIANSTSPTRVYSNNGTVNVTLRVTDSFGSTDTDTIQVVVFGATCPLSVTSQPQSVAACSGEPATFSVAASGSGTFSYQWRRNTVDIIGAVGSSYTIPSVATSDAASYDCEITSDCGGTATSNAATLTINQGPIVLTQPESLTLDEGQTAVFNISAIGTAPFSYQWVKNDAPLPGATSSVLVLSGVNAASQGTYYCNVTNICGTVPTDSAELVVNVSCGCDWDHSGVLSSQDFFDFLTGFFSDNADFNSDGFTTSQDFFDFISCFFSGCN